MTRRFLMAMITLAAVLNWSSVGFAQTTSRQMATIPFKFIFEGTILPPGTYEVELMDSGMLLLLNSDKTPVEGEAATLPLPVNDTASVPELVFVNSSEGYTLSEIRTKEERRLLTSAYGHGKHIGEQLRNVPITSVVADSSASPKQVSAQAR